MVDKFSDDDALWEAEVEHTRKLGKKERVAQESKSVTPQERSDFAGLEKKITPQVRGDNLPDLTLNDTTHLDRNLAGNLRKGKLAVEGKLDLHGNTQEQAFPKLMEFIANSYALGKRCVLVVTGKGSRSPEGCGILQQAVPQWLNVPELRPYVLAFCHAQARDGGSGALYVLLRRHRL